ncbi:MAG: Ig-like domain-containing protein, partial [Pseudomonadota bacterium]
MVNRIRRAFKSIFRQTPPKLHYPGAHPGGLAPRAKLDESLTALEPRCMFDGAGMVTAIENLADDAAAQQAETAFANGETNADTPADPEHEALMEALVGDHDGAPNEIVFVDTGVEGYESILAGIDSDVEIVLLQTDRDGIEQIADVLSERDSIDAVHIISHGDAGALRLGNTVLTQASMSGEHADELAVIRQALSDDADVLIYGCNFAEGEAGKAAADTLAALTGADIAASDDLTGATERGGDWVLETEIGDIDAGVIVGDVGQASFSGLLTTTIDWSDYTSSTEFPPNLDGTTTADITEGGVTVNFRVDTDAAGPTDTASAGNTAETIAGTRGGLVDYLQLYADNATQTDTQTYELTFSSAVNNLNFTLSDIDSLTGQFQDELVIEAWTGGIGGTAVGLSASEVTLDGAPSLTFTDATDTFLAIFNNNVDSADPFGNAEITFANAVDAVRITYSQGSSAPATGGVQAVGLHDITWNRDVTATDDTPAAIDDNSTAAGNVLTNDVDPDETPGLMVTELNGSGAAVGTPTVLASGATLTLNANGTYNYDPSTSATLNGMSAGQSMTDTFTYQVTDAGGATDTATVTITINGANDAPTPTADSGTVGEDDGVTAINVLSNDSDPEGDTLTVTGLDTSGTSGSATVGVGGAINYSPNGQFNSLSVGQTATDTVTYTVSDDGGATSTETVTVTVTGVNDTPTANDDSPGPFANSSGDSVLDLVGNDTDPDSSDVLTVSAINTTGTLGSVTLNSGTVTYNPNGAFAGLSAGMTATDTFTYTVSDGNGGTETATVTVTISGAEVDAVDDSGATDEDTALVVGANGVLGNDTDSDVATVITANRTLNYDAGLDSPSGDGTWRDEEGSAFNWDYGAGISFNGSPGSAHTGITASYTFDGSAVAGFNDPGAGTGDDESFSNLPGDPSVADATFEMWVRLTANGDQDVLFESGAGGDGISLSYDGSVGTNGRLEFKVKDGADDTQVFVDLDSVGGGIDPTAEFIQVVGVVDLGAANGVRLYVNSELAVTAIGDATSLADWSGGDNAGLGGVNSGINFASGGNFEGDIAIFRFYEAAFADADVEQNYEAVHGLRVTEVTDPVTMGNGTLGSPFGLNSGAQVTLNADGSYTYDPNGAFESLASGQTTTDTFQYTLSDGTESDTATVTITITGVDDAPTVTATGLDPTFTEDGSAVDIFSGVTIDAVEPGQTIEEIVFTVSNVSNGSDEIVVIDGTSIPLINTGGTPINTGSGYSIAVVVSGSDVTITATTTGAATGDIQSLVDNLTYQNNSQAPGEAVRNFVIASITDSGSSAGANDNDSVPAIASDITVTGVNDPLVATDNTYVVIGTGSGNFITDDTGAGVDTDPDSSPIVADPSLTSTPANGSVSVNPDGSFVYTANAGYTGPDSFTYRVSTPTNITGLTYEFFDGAPSGDTVDNIPLSSPLATGNASDFDVNALALAETGSEETYAVRYTGYITITSAGTYNFRTTSDDGSKLYIDGVELVDNDGLHAPVTVTSSNVALTAGTHRIVIEFFENTGGDSLVVEYSGDDTGGLGTFANLAGSSALVEGDEATATVTLDVRAVDAIDDSYGTNEDVDLNIPEASGVLNNDMSVTGPTRLLDYDASADSILADGINDQQGTGLDFDAVGLLMVTLVRPTAS